MLITFNKYNRTPFCHRLATGLVILNLDNFWQLCIGCNFGHFIGMASGTTGKYTEDTLKQAVDAVHDNKLSLRKASLQFGVPKSTLSLYVNGKLTFGSRYGLQPQYKLRKKRNSSLSMLLILARLVMDVPINKFLTLLQRLWKRMGVQIPSSMEDQAESGDHYSRKEI